MFNLSPGEMATETFFCESHCMEETQILRHNQRTNIEKTIRRRKATRIEMGVCWWSKKMVSLRSGNKGSWQQQKRDHQIKFCYFPCPLCSLRSIIVSPLVSEFCGNCHCGWCPQENRQRNTEAWLGIGVDENICYLPTLVFPPFPSPSTPPGLVDYSLGWWLPTSSALSWAFRDKQQFGQMIPNKNTFFLRLWSVLQILPNIHSRQSSWYA